MKPKAFSLDFDFTCPRRHGNQWIESGVEEGGRRGSHVMKRTVYEHLVHPNCFFPDIINV